MRILSTILASLFIGSFGAGAFAAPVCIPVEKLTEIATQLKMVVLWKGQGRQGETYAIYANSAGVWDAVLFLPDMSQACIVAEGGNSKLSSIGS